MKTAHTFAHASMLLFLFGTASVARGVCTPSVELAKEVRVAPEARTYETLGSWYADRKQFGCAVDAYRKAVALEPDQARVQYFLGISLYADGKSADAVAPLRHSVQLEPASNQARLALAAALDASGDRVQAELEWRLALARDPRSELALESLGRDLLADRSYGAVISLLKPFEDSGALSDTRAVQLAAAYSSSGLPEDAATLLQKRLQANPASLQLAEALSGVLILESRFQDAVGVLAPVASQHAADMEVQVLYLQTLVLAHDAGAEALGQKLLASAPRQWEVLYFMGMLRQQGDDYSGARSYFERSIAARPGEADVHYRLGMVLSALKDEAGARRELERSIALGLDSPEVHVALAKALRSEGDAEGAQKQFGLYQQRLKAQAARAQAASKAQQGDQAAAAGNPQQTAEDYREALALDPKEPVLAFKLAMALDKAGDRAGERAALQQAVSLDAHMAMAQNQLGYLDAGDGDAAGAVQHFQLAVGADPGFSKAWMNLAATLCLQSKWGEARDALHHVFELEGNDAKAKALLQKIDSMEEQAQR